MAKRIAAMAFPNFMVVTALSADLLLSWVETSVNLDSDWRCDELIHSSTGIYTSQLVYV